MPSASLLVRRTSGARAICLSRARANSVGCSDVQLPCIGSGGQPALAPAGGLRRLRPYRARRQLGAFLLLPFQVSVLGFDNPAWPHRGRERGGTLDGGGLGRLA